MIIWVPDNNPSERILEEDAFFDELEEMAGFKKPDTGLPVNLRLDDSGAYIRGRHAKRIKFQGDYGNRTNAKNMFSMTISKNNPEIPAKQIPKLRLPTKDVDAIKAFVKNNADLLGKLADEEISFMAFIKRMKLS